MVDKTSFVFSAFVAGILGAVFLKYIAQPMPITVAKKEHFMQQTAGAPVDGVSNALWSSMPAPTPAKSYEVANDNHLFQFQDVPMKPECCPSQISGSTGCACLSEEQQKKLAYRGGNRA